nr:SoxR reducing system RseC family protein [Maliibacterium massiliense]
MTEQGLVVATKDTSATVQFVRTSACARCGACSLASESRAMLLEVENTLHARVGQRVEITLDGGNMLRASAIAYLIPLLGLLAGALAGPAAAELFAPPLPSDITAACLAIAGALAGYLVLRLLNPRLARSRRYEPRMQRILDADTDA